MRKIALAGEPCPMCGSQLRLLRCATCHGVGRSGVLFEHVCKTCSGSGKLIGCPNYFAHPGLGAPTERDRVPWIGST
jgi:hypothetical protein